ncbi:uncharacterized protein K02A2.6-like [Ornithodoros turicata]|uniref:uncharacterized protein K02A2.6-like n=1 Tax=Ornithodoros turicata TaxID=34597 RepID=UPI0031396C82
MGQLPVLGVLKMEVTYGHRTATASLYVVDREGPSLCGRDVIAALDLLTVNVNAVNSEGKVTNLKQEFKSLFEPRIGLMVGPPAHLHLKQGITPKFCKARSLPYVMRDKVSAELDRLCEAGVLTPVTHSEWATPIVPVMKKDGTVRICSDFKVTLNEVCDVEQTEDGLANSEAVCSIQILEEGPLSAKQLADLTSQDATLSALRDAIQRGWPHQLQDKALQPYWSRRDELSTDHGLIMWGRRIIIPAKARHAMLLELHSTHSGMATMKAVARSLFWWPGIDGDIESTARHCLECQQAQPMPPAKEPLSWPSTTIRWSRVHIDYAGPIDEMMLLIVVDSFSRWIEAITVKNASSEQTVKELRSVFARFGIPHCVVSDNGTPFTGKAFQDFVKANRIRHIRTAPYHPQSNGLAERAVRTVKDALKKMKTGDLRTNVDRWLHSYRRSPNTVSGKSPSEMLLGYNIRSRLDLISVQELHKEAISKPDRARPSPDKESSSETGVLRPGTHVFARNYGRGQKWIPGVVQNQKGSRMAVVKTAVGDMTHHAYQLRRRPASRIATEDDTWMSDVELHNPSLLTPVRPPRRSGRCRRSPLRYGQPVTY